MSYSYNNEPAIQDVDSVFNDTFMGVMRHVYVWMCLGLFITAFVSMALIYTPFNALLGFVIGSVVNFFLASSALEWILTYAGILLFIGLTVYDSQKIKIMVANAMQSPDTSLVKRVGLLGALSLYLDFVNLFLLLLRVMGGRRR